MSLVHLKYSIYSTSLNGTFCMLIWVVKKILSLEEIYNTWFSSDIGFSSKKLYSYVCLTVLYRLRKCGLSWHCPFNTNFKQSAFFLCKITPKQFIKTLFVYVSYSHICLQSKDGCHGPNGHWKLLRVRKLWSPHRQ